MKWECVNTLKFKSLGTVGFLKKEMNTFFKKNDLNQSILKVKTFVMVKKISIMNKCQVLA